MKQKPVADKQQDREIQALISANMIRYDKAPEELAVKMRISRATFYNRYKSPETMTIGEFRRLCSALNISKADMLQHLGGE